MNQYNLNHDFTFCVEFVKKVMDKCKPTQADDSGWIPLHYAAHLGDVELVKLFLKKDTSLAYMTEEKGMSALHISANKGHVDVRDTLIKKCPDTCELLDNKGRTALHYAVESGKPETVKFLLRKEEFQNLINEQDEEGNTPLHLAAYRGYAIIVHQLSHFRKVDNVIQNKKDMTTLDILRSTTQKNILFWLADEVSCTNATKVYHLWEKCFLWKFTILPFFIIETNQFSLYV